MSILKYEILREKTRMNCYFKKCLEQKKKIVMRSISVHENKIQFSLIFFFKKTRYLIKCINDFDRSKS